MRGRGMMAGFLVAVVGLTGSAGDDPAPPAPPAGWKEFMPASKVFAVWLPAGGSRTERTRTIPFKGRPLSVSLVQVEDADKTVYRASYIGIPIKGIQKVDSNAIIEVVRDAFLKEVGGTVADESAVKLGRVTGKEYLVDTPRGGRAALRVFATGSSVYEVGVVGTRARVESEAAKAFLGSFKHAGMVKEEAKKKEAADKKP